MINVYGKLYTAEELTAETIKKVKNLTDDEIKELVEEEVKKATEGKDLTKYDYEISPALSENYGYINPADGFVLIVIKNGEVTISFDDRIPGVTIDEAIEILNEVNNGGEGYREYKYAKYYELNPYDLTDEELEELEDAGATFGVY